MIFSCGESWDAEFERRSNWHDFYPVFPRTVGVKDGKVICAWLQTVERRGIERQARRGRYWMWEYRLKETK